MYKNESLHQQLSNNCKTEIQRFDWDRSAAQVWEIIATTAAQTSKKEK